MAISKITLNGVVQIDLTSDTVTAQTLVDDYVAHGADGNSITGELVLPTARTASDVSVSGATVTVPAGAYASQVQKSVASGTAGTPTATKGTVNNHSISVTPSVTNTTGYITGSTINGTAVTVTASELASGNKAITQNGTDIDVVGYSTVSVAIPTSPYTEADIKKMVERANTFTSFTIPSDVTQIGKGAFYGCSQLNFSSLPSGVTSIGERAFYSCSKLTLTSLPSGVKSIGQYAFYMCSKLGLTSLPSGITTIGDYGFYGCAMIALTSLPSNLTSISQYSFARCASITITGLPSGVTTISPYAFSSCTGITQFSLPNGLTTIHTNAFDGCANLVMTTLPSSLTSINTQAFANCESLISITCEATGLKFIGTSAFAASSTNYSMKLREAYFPYLNNDGTGTTAHSNVFGSSTAAYACQLLEIADIGKAPSIGSNAFANCYKLQTLILRKSSSVCTLSYASAFTNTPMSGYNGLTGTVYVPQSLISTYQTANNWKTLYDAGTVTFVKIEGSVYEL